MPSDSFLKLTHWYRSVALLLLNIIVAVALLNLIIFAAGVVKDKIAPASNPVSKKYGDPLQYVYPHRNKAEIKQLLDETWNRNLVYEPFTEFKEREFHGKYVNVSEYGFRHNKGQGPWPPNPGNFNVFVFGGSTLFGYGVSDEETIASRLQDYLKTLNPKGNVSIYNFGRGFYFSTQERILFAQLLSSGYVPNLAVFIDGTNERLSLFPGAYGTEIFSDFMEGKISWQIGRLLSYLPISQMVRKFYEPLKFQVNIKRETQNVKTEFFIMQIMDRYLANKKIIEAMAQAYDVQSVFVWQPFPMYQYDQNYKLFIRNNEFVADNLTLALYQLMAELVKKKNFGSNFLFLADMQIDKKEPLYVDHVHYTAKFSDEIAGRITQLLLDRGLLPTNLARIRTDFSMEILDRPAYLK